MTAFVSDQSLVVASRSGDMRATEELVRRYAWLARREATRFYVDGCTRDDLVQEGMLGVLAAIDRYELDRGAPFNGLAETIVRRRIIDRWRREKAPHRRILNQSRRMSDRQDEEDDDGGAFGDLADPRADVPTIVELREAARETAAALRRLPVRQARCVLRVAVGDTYEEIGASEGLTFKQIDNAVQKARRTLRRAA